MSKPIKILTFEREYLEENEEKREVSREDHLINLVLFSKNSKSWHSL